MLTRGKGCFICSSTSSSSESWSACSIGCANGCAIGCSIGCSYDSSAGCWTCAIYGSTSDSEDSSGSTSWTVSAS